jgi:hypothetical protein
VAAKARTLVERKDLLHSALPATQVACALQVLLSPHGAPSGPGAWTQLPAAQVSAVHGLLSSHAAPATHPPPPPPVPVLVDAATLVVVAESPPVPAAAPPVPLAAPPVPEALALLAAPPEPVVPLVVSGGVVVHDAEKIAAAAVITGIERAGRFMGDAFGRMVVSAGELVSERQDMFVRSRIEDDMNLRAPARPGAGAIGE